MKTKGKTGRLVLLTTAAIAVGLVAAPAASASLTESGFTLHAERSDGTGKAVEISATGRVELPIESKDTTLGAVSCGPASFRLTQSMVNFANEHPGEIHKDGWNLLTVDGKTPTSASEVNGTMGWLDLSINGQTVVRYLNNGGENCEIQDYRSTATGKLVGYEVNDYAGNSETRIVEIDGIKIAERQRFNAQDDLIIDRWDQSHSYDVKRKGNPLQSATIPRSVTVKDRNGDQKLQFQSAWDQSFSITKHANGSTSEVFSGSEGSDLAFDGVRPREARFDSSGNWISEQTVAQWNSSHGTSWDGRAYSGYSGLGPSFKSSLG